MNYREQARFLSDYYFRWLISSSVLLLASSLVLRVWGRSAAVFLLVIFAVCAALSYLPKYLHIHGEPNKRYRWAIRSRWILIGLAGLIAAASVRLQPTALIVIVAAAVWLAMVNAFLKVACKNRAGLSFRFAPFIYFAADFWLVLVMAYLGVNWLIIAAVLAVSGFLALVLNEGRWLLPLLVVSATTVLFQTGIPAEARGLAIFLNGILAVLFVATYFLTSMATAQADKNYQKTIADLQAFTGMSAEETRRRLATSRDALVESWKASKPNEDDKQALATWYAANSLNYLFDTALFHLSYKHIVFTLDVLRLSKGRCLDYGAGKGELSIELAQRGFQTTYFDVPGTTRKYAEWNAARQELQLCFTSSKQEIEAEAARQGKFDTIVSLDVLEHLPDLKGELEFLTALLAPGGTMVLTVPAGATESHPMHLAHNVDAHKVLRGLGLQSRKSLAVKFRGSEILRKPDCLIYQRPL